VAEVIIKQLVTDYGLEKGKTEINEKHIGEIVAKGE